MAAASTTGSLFGGGSTGFAFGSGATSTGFGASTIGGSSLGGSTLGTGGFSAIKPFGASTTTTSSLSTPFGKSTAAVAGTTTGFAFGGLGSTAGTSFSGMNAAKTTATAPTLGIFGQTTQTGQTPGLTTGLTLGGTPGASTATGLTLGGLQTTSGLGGGLFKSSAANTTTTSLLGPSATGLGLGTSTGLGSLGGFTPVKTTAVTSGTASAAFAGLGGTGTSTGVATTGTVAGVAGRQGDVKDMLPGPLNEIVEHIKKYVKEQKEHRDEISRVSGSALDKVREETISLRQTLALVSNSIQRDGCALENLKMDVSQELKNAEIAQRTNDIPPALQHENIAPQEYFQRMVESFEERMLMYRKQIEIMESHLASLSQGQALTPQDLSEVMHKVHETFIALAAQLHEIHEGVRVQKEQFLNYRRAYFKDTTDVFAGSTKDLSKTSTEFGIGPSPFRIMPNNSAAAMAATMNITAPHALGLSSLQTNPSGLTGALGTAGALGMGLQGTSLGSSFGTSLVPGTVNPTVGTAFGTPLGTSTLGTSALGTTGGFGSTSLTGGFGTPGLGTSTVGTLNSAGTGLGGSGFGVGTSAFTAQPKFQLQRPPTGNKRGKRR